MVGSLVTLQNFDNAIGEITFFQGEGKPMVAALLDGEGNRIKVLIGGEWRDRKILTSKYTLINNHGKANNRKDQTT